MPISAERMKRYPGGSIRSAEWLWIRFCALVRADFRCEGTPRYPDCRAENGKPHPHTGSHVVLTIMHLDHDLANVDPSNFKAGCQRCHLTYDAKLHAQNAAKTRRAKSPQLDLLERSYENSQARAEWDHYHPGEPCPDIELPHPRKSDP